MVQCPELGSPTSEAQAWHQASCQAWACQPHSQVRGDFLAFWEVWGLLPVFSRCSVGIVPHVDVFLMYMWGGRWSLRLTRPPSWRSPCNRRLHCRHQPPQELEVQRHFFQRVCSLLERQKGRKREDPLGQGRRSKTHNCNHHHFRDWAQFTYSSFVTYSFGVTFKKPLLNPKSGRFTPMFSSKNFVVLALTFRSMIHLWLIFMCSVR